MSNRSTSHRKSQRRRSCTRHVVSPLRLESLERRIALSVAPTPVVTSSGDLQIVGTDIRDVIEVGQSESNVRVKLKTGNAAARYFLFDPAEVSSISVYGLSGSDIIEIDDVFVIPAKVSSGFGNDFVRTGSGNDTVYGSLGSDDIETGAGDDVVYAGGGHDLVRTEEGNDIVFGEGGNDSIWTKGGNDWVDAGTGNDKVWTHNGDDTVYGGRGRDRIVAGGGNDFVDAGDHADVVHTGNGDDVIIAGSGRDTIHAGSGNDIVDCGSGPDFADGGPGNDTIDGGDDGDRIIGGTGDDVITDVQGDNVILGGPGNDIATVHADETNRINLGPGDDTIRKVFASYAADLQPNTPAAGWAYLWNRDGAIGDPDNYSPLLATSHADIWYDTNGVNGLPDADPGFHLYLGLVRDAGFNAALAGMPGGHPGKGSAESTSGGFERFSIASYTVPMNGVYEIAESALIDAGSSGDGVRVLVYLNADSTPLIGNMTAGFNSPVSFDVSLGLLEAGDTIYVAVGSGATDLRDAFALQYEIVAVS